MPLLGSFTSQLFTAIAKVAGGVSLLRTLNNPNAYGTSVNDQFGEAVAISGNYAIVSTYLEDDASGTSSGKAYIFSVTTGALLYTLDNPNPYGTSADDQFGISVAISGNYAIVGAHQEDDAGADSGKAYIFNVTTGALVHTLTNPNAVGTSASDYFGYSVAISDNYAIVGAYGEEPAGSNFSGYAYIYNVTTGALLHTLNNPNPYGTSADDNFGYSVAISGNYAIVGAYGEDDAAGTGSGKSYLYTVTTGSLVHTLTNPNAYGTNADDRFGQSVAISGNYAIVGAYQEDDASGTSSGKAYIYNVTTGALLHTLNNPNPLGTSDIDYFGWSVSISGNYAIVGAYREEPSNSGKVYIYNVTTGALLHTLNSPVSNVGFGYSVAASGDYAIVGTYVGADAYIYNVTTGALVHTLNNPNAFGTSVGDSFGSGVDKKSVAISDNYAIVGASREDDAGGTDSGKAYIFNVTTGALLQTLDNPNAFGTSASDSFGGRVAVSGDYAIVASNSTGVNAEDDAGGSGSGKAYIFNVTTGALLQTLDNPNAFGTSASDSFGNDVAISGDYVIVGAPSEDDAGGTSSGKAYVYQIESDQSVITNLLNTPLTFASTAGIGYLRFMGDNGFVIPAGDNSQRRASPEVGETRWNTDEDYLECYDGTVWAVSTGGGIEVDVPIMEDLGHAYTLMLG